MNEFDDIQGHDAWRAKLAELLAQAQRFAREDDVEPRFAVAERLTQYIEHSFPNDEVVRALDQIAGKAATGLLEQTIDERLKSIVARNAELAALAKQFGAEAAAAEETAAGLRLERVQQAVASLTDGVAALKELGAALGSRRADADLENTLARSKSALDSLSALLQRLRAAA